MRSAIAAVLGLLLILVAVPVREGAAQAPPPAPSPPPPGAEAVLPAPPVFKMEEIDQLMAPIALYPDDLLAQILTAATYPLEIVMAARWVADPKNAALKGDALTQALQAQSWDPSVKSLVPFPAVLKMMSDHLEWTQKLGDAFLEQAQDCLASVQRLRQRAQSAGKLTSTPQQTVTTQHQAIIIAPADPEVVYVPAYNPAVVFGAWPYPDYPPYYYSPPPGYALGTGLAAGLAFGAGVAITRGLWGWGSPNWRTGAINVNVNRFNAINVNRTAISAGTWQHNAVHRQGVAYRNVATSQRFGQVHAGAAARRDYRGFQGGAGAAGGIANRPGGGAIANRPGGDAIANRPGGGAVANRPGGGAVANRPGGGAIANRPGGGAVANRPSGGAVANRAPAAVARPQPAARPGPAAFNPGNGGQARAAQFRGQASRQQMGNVGVGRAQGGGFCGGGGGGARAGAGGGGGGFRGGGGRHR